MTDVEVVEGDRSKVSEKVKEMYDWHCIITGQGGPDAQEEIEAAHIDHAGMGGRTSTHTIDNVIPVHYKVHEVWHGQRDYFMVGDHKVTKICDVEYEPFEELVVKAVFNDNPKCRPLPKEWLWFYQRPTEQSAEVAFRYHRMVVNGKETIVAGLLSIGEGLYWIREMDGYHELGYDSFTAYLGSPDVGMSRQYAYSFMKVYETFGLQLPCSPERLEPIGVNKLYMIADHVDEDNVDEMLAMAEGNSMSDLDKYLSDGQTTPDCTKCINTTQADLGNFKQGPNKLHYCALHNHPYIIETLDKESGENNACSDFEEG